jgi:outer membrane protein OmpA-like peptidoglycan-associated protein
MIYFDLDKSNIRQEAALDLEKILDVLNQNPTMKN